MSRMKQFWVHIEPRACMRARARVIQRKGGKAFATFYDPKQNQDYKAEVKEQVALFMRGEPLYSGNLHLELIFDLKRPKALKGNPPHQTKPDVDNLAKIVLDACNGLMYHDDKEITSLTIIKRYAMLDEPLGFWLKISEG